MLLEKYSFMGSSRRLASVWLMILSVSCGKQSVPLKNLSSQGQGSQYVRVPRSFSNVTELKMAGFEFDHKYHPEFLFGYVPTENLERLAEMDLRIVDPLVALQDFDPVTLNVTSGVRSLEELRAGYHNYVDLTAELRQVAATYPDIVELNTSGQSVEKRELWYVKISDHVQSDENEPKILYLANMHGDEVVGREMMLRLINELTSQYGKNQKITDLVDHAQIFIMPSMNPDGFERSQRENRNRSDLNRNFPDFTSDPRNSPEGRQVETAHVMRLHDKHHFALALNFHGGEVCMNLPWDTQSNSTQEKKFADDALLHSLARRYADVSPEMVANDSGSFDRGVTYGYEWYEVNGGLQDWSIYYDQSAHATVELSHAKWPPANTLDSYWNINRGPLVDYLNAVRQGVFVEVVDEAGNRLKNVKAQLATSKRWIDYPDGFILRPSLQGAQTLEVSVPGFVNQKYEVSSGFFNGQFQRIVVR